MTLATPSETELRRWVLPAQQLFWAVRAITIVSLYTENHYRLCYCSSSPRYRRQGRWKHWAGQKLTKCQQAAKGAALWAGGDVKDVRRRLVVAEFSRGTLGPTDHGPRPPGAHGSDKPSGGWVG